MFKRKPAHDNNSNNYGQPIDHTILPGGSKFPGSVTQGSYAVMVSGNMAANDPDFGKRTIDAFIDAVNGRRTLGNPRME